MTWAPLIVFAVALMQVSADPANRGDAGLEPLPLRLPKATNAWPYEVDHPFPPPGSTFSLEAGAAMGLADFGSHQAHDLSLLSLSYGRCVSGPEAKGTDRGSWELRAEIFGGAQFAPAREWLVGLTPHLRYNFGAGRRLIPFADLGVGLTGTSIGLPDLSTRYEFNTQGTVGVHWLFRDHLAWTAEIRGIHISNAGFHEPNAGLNSVVGMVGLTRFF